LLKLVWLQWSMFVVCQSTQMFLIHKVTWKVFLFRIWSSDNKKFLKFLAFSLKFFSINWTIFSHTRSKSFQDKIPFLDSTSTKSPNQNIRFFCNPCTHRYEKHRQLSEILLWYLSIQLISKVKYQVLPYSNFIHFFSSTSI
jgi:hypothetical protein